MMESAAPAARPGATTRGLGWLPRPAWPWSGGTLPPQLPQVTRQHIDDPAGGSGAPSALATAGRAGGAASPDHAPDRRGDAAIFAAHALILQDRNCWPTCRRALAAMASTPRLPGMKPWNELAATYQALDDAYMQARVADVRDVARQVLGQLITMEMPSLALPGR